MVQKLSKSYFAIVAIFSCNFIAAQQESVSKRIYAVIANDNTKGFSHVAFQVATDQLKQDGHTVDSLDLYSVADKVPFFYHDNSKMKKSSFYADNKNSFMQADVLLIVFPVYWYSIPGILKCWIDAIQGWAYKYESGSYAKALHHIKKVIIVYSCSQNYTDVDRSTIPVKQQLLETFKFMGISDIEIYGVDNIYGLTSEQITGHLNQVKQICTIK